MTVLNIAFTDIQDPEKMQAYIQAAAPLMKQHGAEVVVRGRYLKTLLGEAKQPHVAGVFRFQNMDAAEKFYSCDDYLDLVPLRDAAGLMSFNFYEE